MRLKPPCAAPTSGVAFSAMRRFRIRPTATAILALAALALSSIAVLGHEHVGPTLGGGHSELPTFVAGHSHPDRTPHVESATRVDSSPCIACILSQRQQAAGGLSLSLDALAPSLSPVATGGVRSRAAGSYRLPALRAPPSA